MATQRRRSQIDELRDQVSRILDSLDPDTGIAGNVIFQVDSAKERTFIKNADVLAKETRELPGLKIFAYHQQKLLLSVPGQTQAVQYIMYEAWNSCRLFRAQLNSEHLKHFQDIVGDLVVAPPDPQFYFSAPGQKGEENDEEEDEDDE